MKKKVNHYLKSLLEPSSVVIVGATPRKGAIGNVIVEQILTGNYNKKNIYIVNPKYTEVEGIKSYSSFASLPLIPEHVVFVVPDSIIEEKFIEATNIGIKAATIFSSLAIDNDQKPLLVERIKKIAKEKKILLCGGNGMGFYNFAKNVWICGYKTRKNHLKGNVTLITHSGSVLNSLVDAESRINYNLVVSPGQELVNNISDYLDYALELSSTKVIGIFMETARNPDLFVKGLKKASEKSIPVVVLKVGRTDDSSRMAQSHSGAMTGSDKAYQAIFKKYGVIRVNSLDEMAFTLMMFSKLKVGKGGLVSIHDSGGEKALFSELASDFKVPLAKLQSSTKASLSKVLEPGLVAENPLDAYGTLRGYTENFTKYLTILMNDPNTAIGAIVSDRAAYGKLYDEVGEFIKITSKLCSKPIVVVSNHQGSGFSQLMLDLDKEGYLIMDGIPVFLKSIKHLFSFRDFSLRERKVSSHKKKMNGKMFVKWRNVIKKSKVLNEYESLRFFNDCNLKSNSLLLVKNKKDLLSKIKYCKFPLALKTSEVNQLHKAKSGGVFLNIKDSKELIKAYSQLKKTIGPKATVGQMFEGSVAEVLLGMVADRQFGPILLLGTGGIYTETFKDIMCFVPPLGKEEAYRILLEISSIKLAFDEKLIKKSTLISLAEDISKFSSMIINFKNEIKEIDVNPIAISDKNFLAVDGLVISK